MSFRTENRKYLIEFAKNELQFNLSDANIDKVIESVSVLWYTNNHAQNLRVVVIGCEHIETCLIDAICIELFGMVWPKPDAPTEFKNLFKKLTNEMHKLSGA